MSQQPREYPVTFNNRFQLPETSLAQLRALVKENVERQDYSMAISLLDQLIARFPKSALDYNNRGLMYFKQGDYHLAIKDFNRAIALNGSLDRAYNNRANCYALQGDLAAALEDYEMALDLNPYNLRAWINQGITLRELELYDLALESFDFASLLGDNWRGRVYAERGYTYYQRGDWNCAIADYQRSLTQLAKDDPYRQKVNKWLHLLLDPLRA